MKFLLMVLGLLFVCGNNGFAAKPRSTYESRPRTVFTKSTGSGLSGSFFGDTQKGLASWYGYDLQGSRTATGGRYNQNSLTAAHKTLPFGTKVLVKNLKNEKTVEVQINDRGPYVKGRIIDLSLAAAKKIDLLKCGVAPVVIEVID